MCVCVCVCVSLSVSVGLSLPPQESLSLHTWGPALRLFSNPFLPSDKMTQAAAETAYDMVSPSTLSIEPKKAKRFPHHRLAHQPVDLREGVAKAYSVVKEVRREVCGQVRTACMRFYCLVRW